MRSNKILEHTADIRLQVEGDSLKELFAAALEGMNKILITDGCTTSEKNGQNELIEITATNPTTLLIDFLSEILTRSHINHLIYCEIEFKEMTEISLKVEITGTRVDSFYEDIKAVTYHEADVQKSAEGNYQTVIIFDI